MGILLYVYNVATQKTCKKTLCKKICVFNTKDCQIAAQVYAQFTFNITVLINFRM